MWPNQLGIASGIMFFGPLVGSAKELDFLHKIGVFHRDIKPANVIVFNEKEEGLVWKWCYFGIYKLWDWRKKVLLLFNRVKLF